MKSGRWNESRNDVLHVCDCRLLHGRSVFILEVSYLLLALLCLPYFKKFTNAFHTVNGTITSYGFKKNWKKSHCFILRTFQTNKKI